jgi:hypothetical protein
MIMAARRRVTDVGESRFDEKHWHISRGIPLGLIFSLLSFFLLQTGGVIWFFAHQDSRIDAVEHIQITASAIGDKLQASSAQQGIQTARLEEKVVSIQATVNRIEALLTPPRTK